MAIRWCEDEDIRSSCEDEGSGGREEMGENISCSYVALGWEHIKGSEALVYCTYIQTGENDCFPTSPSDFSWSVGWKS